MSLSFVEIHLPMSLPMFFFFPIGPSKWTDPSDSTGLIGSVWDCFFWSFLPQLYIYIQNKTCQNQVISPIWGILQVLNRYYTSHKHSYRWTPPPQSSRYYVNTNILLPITKPFGLSFAEMVGPKQTKYFVSRPVASMGKGECLYSECRMDDDDDDDEDDEDDEE